MTPESAIGELEQANADLLAADVADLTALERILDRRGRAVARLHDQPVSGAMLPRLRAALEAGAEASRRLRLARAEAQEALARAHREGHLLRAIVTGGAPLCSRFDCSG
jgi:hypothetical protein